jgi:hypothetical protein
MVAYLYGMMLLELPKAYELMLLQFQQTVHRELFQGG